MRLKRLGMYRATRVLSWILPVVIIAFISIAAWSYLARTRDPKPVVPRGVDALPPGLEVSTTALQYYATEDDRNLFLVKASRLVGFKDNRNVLENVEVTIYPQKSDDRERRIRGAECRHDRNTNSVNCTRNVSVELAPGTIAHTEDLSYDPAKGMISSPVHTRLDREGEMTGTSGRMEYFIDPGMMRLTDGFKIDLTRGGGMSGGIAVFQSRESWVTVSQGLEIASGNGVIRGGNGRAELLPGTYRPKQVTVETTASADAPTFSVNSDWLQADLSDAGDIEHVIGRGNVRAERKAAPAANSPGASETSSLAGTLTGPEVEAWLEKGLLKVVEARQHPHFDSGAGGSLNASETIRIEPAGVKAGSVKTTGISTFKRDGLSIEGRDFVISVKDADNEQTFNTLARATLTASGLQSKANRTTAVFDTKLKTLTSMEQNGDVSFVEEKGGRKGSTAKLIVRESGDRIEMEGAKSELNYTEGTLYAPKIMLDRKRESFLGEGGNGKIRMVGKGSGDSDTTILARRVEGQLSGSNPRVEYTGDVEMYPDNNSKVEARKKLTLFPEEKRFEAEGDVQTYSAAQNQTVKAQFLEFRTGSARGSQIAHYRGSVFVSGDFDPPKAQAQKTNKKRHLELKSDDLEVHSGNGSLDRIVATGSVEITQGVRKGRGTFLTYDVATGTTLLTGTSASPAMVNVEGKDSQGCSIRMEADGSGEIRSCENGSVITSIPVKKN